jgi:hypothetical protein
MAGDWMSARTRAAMAQVNAGAAETHEAAREASEAMRRAKRKAAAEVERYARMEEKAAELFRAGGAGDAARQLQGMVDRGDLTWREIQAGVTDPEATTLYLESRSAMLDGVARVYREDESEPDEDDEGGTIFR